MEVFESKIAYLLDLLVPPGDVPEPSACSTMFVVAGVMSGELTLDTVSLSDSGQQNKFQNKINTKV